MTVGSKICTRCKEDKPLEAFHRLHSGLHGRQFACKECNKRAMRGERMRPPKVPGFKRCFKCRRDKAVLEFYPHPGRPDKCAVYCIECQTAGGRSDYHSQRLADPVRVWAKFARGAAKKRASARGIPFALTTELLISKAPTHCPVLGMPLDYSGGVAGTTAAGPHSASVDRIVPALGYVPGNIAIISVKANMIKQNATPEEIMQVGWFFCAHQLHHSGETDNGNTGGGLRNVGLFGYAELEALVHSIRRRRRPRGQRGLHGRTGLGPAPDIGGPEAN